MTPARLISPRFAGALLALISGLGLLGALALQYFAGEAPCHLCIWQRYPHLAVVLLGALAWIWQPRLMVAVISLVLFGSAALAVYHVGIEQGLWALPAGCLAGQEATSVAELRTLLHEAPPACDQVSLRIGGLSLAAWNAVGSTVLAAYALVVAWRPSSTRGGAQ